MAQLFILLRKSETLCLQVANVLGTDQVIRFTLSHQNYGMDSLPLSQSQNSRQS